MNIIESTEKSSGEQNDLVSSSEAPPSEPEMPSFSVTEDEEGQLFIEGTPAQTKESVFRFLEGRTSLISGDEFKKNMGTKAWLMLKELLAQQKRGKLSSMS